MFSFFARLPRLGPSTRWTTLAASLTGTLCLVSACQAQPQSPAGADGAINALRAKITTEIGPASCQRDDQCRTLGVGERPCGGPEAWLPYAQASGRGEKLAAWAAEWQRLRRAQITQSGLMSSCQVLPDPGASCVQQRCTLRAVPPVR